MRLFRRIKAGWLLFESPSRFAYSWRMIFSENR